MASGDAKPGGDEQVAAPDVAAPDVAAPDVAAPDVAAPDVAALDMDAALDAAADELYGIPPEEFVAARDARVALAREHGDRELARALGRLKRPTRAAWLANLLARNRSEELAALVELAGGLADAQRNLDGPALRTLSVQRQRLVSSMAGQARALAMQAGHEVTETVERELQGILEAALAQPDVAEEVLGGRLARTVSYTGFGPEVNADSRATPAKAPAKPPENVPAGSRARPAARPRAGQAAEPPRAEQDRVAGTALAAAQRELTAAQRELTAAENEAERSQRQRERDHAAHALAEQDHADARARAVELTAELETARRAERSALAAVRAAARPARESTRAAQSATARLARARARLDEASGN